MRLDPNAPAARELWQWLGYSYAAVDFDGHPDTMPLDLNFDQVPESKRGRFAIVTNYGTTEHVANQLNAFKVIHDLASCDGVMIHTLPTQGHVNHGLVNYNMKFFWKLAQANEYKWLYANVYASAIVHEIPENVFACIEQWEPEVATTMREYRLRETTLVTVLRKTSTAPFVPPFDKPDGMSQETDDANLLTRYPTIFRPKH